MAENEIKEEKSQTTSIEVTDLRSVLDKIGKAFKALFGDSDIHVGVKNPKMNADVNIGKDNFQLNLKKADKKEPV